LFAELVGKARIGNHSSLIVFLMIISLYFVVRFMRKETKSIYLFKRYSGLNSGPHVSEAGILPFEPLCQPFFVWWVFSRETFVNYLPGDDFKLQSF
jgi:hypothetical protein